MPEAHNARDGAPLRGRRWPYLGRPQILLLVAALATMIASFLPWLDTAFGSTSGAALGGLYTFYAGLLAMPGAMLRRRRMAIGHALVLAVVAIGVPAWRLVWAARRLPGFGEAWLPGPGLVLVLISGAVAAAAVVGLVGAAKTTSASPTSPADR